MLKMNKSFNKKGVMDQFVKWTLWIIAFLIGLFVVYQIGKAVFG
jgi:hypothetical protein